MLFISLLSMCRAETIASLIAPPRRCDSRTDVCQSLQNARKLFELVTNCSTLQRWCQRALKAYHKPSPKLSHDATWRTAAN